MCLLFNGWELQEFDVNSVQGIWGFSVLVVLKLLLQIKDEVGLLLPSSAKLQVIQPSECIRGPLKTIPIKLIKLIQSTPQNVLLASHDRFGAMAPSLAPV